MSREIDFLGSPDEMQYYGNHPCELCGAIAEDPEDKWFSSVVVIDGVESWACKQCSSALVKEKWSDEPIEQ